MEPSAVSSMTTFSSVSHRDQVVCVPSEPPAAVEDIPEKELRGDNGHEQADDVLGPIGT